MRKGCDTASAGRGDDTVRFTILHRPCDAISRAPRWSERATTAAKIDIDRPGAKNRIAGPGSK